MIKLLIILACIVGVVAVYEGILYLLKRMGKTEGQQYKTFSRVVPVKVLKYAFLIGIAVMVLFPFLYAFLLSFKTGDDVFRASPIPHPFVFKNYKRVLSDGDINLIGSFFNSLLYAIAPITVGVLTSTMAAYALSRLHFRGRDKIFGILFATMCIPGVITLVPSYVLFARLYGWTDTPLPLIIPGMFGSVGVMFFLRQFLLTLPKEIEEAGILDGLNKGGVFFRLIMPLSWPAMLAQFLLAFNGAYNDFMAPLMYLGSNKSRFTIQLTIYSMYSSNVRQMEVIMAGCMLALLPSILLFAFAQKYFMGSGISVDGLK